MSRVRPEEKLKFSQRDRRGRGLLLAAVLLAVVPWAGGLEAQVWEVGEQGIELPGGSQASAEFGRSVASGDFNGDGLRDLAVGSPSWSDGAEVGAGRVDIYYGTSSGLTQTALFLEGDLAGQALGQALAAGDFDGDDVDELAIGAPGFDVGAFPGAGRVFILDFEAGMEITFWDQEVAGVPGFAEDDDHFGYALSSGDFDNDQHEDLAVGIPFEDALLDNSGALTVLYGSTTGLTATGSQLVMQTDVISPERAGALFGATLAAGNFDADFGHWDLAVGYPGFPIDTVAGAGGVAVLFGGNGGLALGGLQQFDHADFGGVVEEDDGFGWALAAADLNRTGACWVSFACRTDLAIGVPGQDIGAESEAGQIVIAFGGTGGIQVAGAQLFDQGDLSPLASNPEAGDRFGMVLQAEYFHGRNLDGPGPEISADDLVIGVPFEQWGSTAGQGIVHLVFGGPSGLNSGEGQYRLAAPGLSSAPAAVNDYFGLGLALGDFDGDDWVDLAVGVPGRDAGSNNAGMVQVLYGALFADGFESAATLNWSSSVPTLGGFGSLVVDDATSAEERAP